MQKTSRRVSGSRNLTRAAGLVLLAIVSAGISAARAQTLPTDATPTCTVTAAQFKTWFQSGAVTLNGVVLPANGITFNEFNAQNQHINCPFYQWAKQMFLWLTSPTPPVGYGNTGGRILDSAAFYDVSPLDSTGHRTFIPHVLHAVRRLNLRAAQVGPHGLPIVFSTAGQMLEVQNSTAKPLVLDKTGTPVEIESARLGTDKKPVLLDKTGAAVELLPRANIIPRAGGVPTVQKFIIGGIVIFVDSANNVIDVEQGEAVTNGVLEAQTTQGGSLVYYATIVNDVYAYFLTGVADGKILPSTASPPTAEFPTTQAGLNAIVNFAANAAAPNKKTFPDPNALTVEVKSAWVEAAGLPNLSSYITMTATIPSYDTSDPSKWTPNGQKTVELALVGIHVVGSVNGHPEMVWATFEHFGNAPAGAYSYNSTSSPSPKTISPSPAGAGTWLFSKANSSGPFLDMLMDVSSGDIVANPATGKIGPSDTIHWKAFGAASNALPNPLDASIAASNSEVISINQSVSGLMPSGDVRNNYFMTGATWTELGEAPGGSFSVGGNEVGTSELANSTMETYQQGQDTTTAGSTTNCFDCHAFATPSVSTNGSHMFGALKPLF
jgi:hypothetical protein